MRRRAHPARAALAALALVFGTLWSAAAHAECISAPDPEVVATPVTGSAIAPTGDDGRGRVVAPVWVNGHGPFRFIIDTGANRTVLSKRLADRLGLVANTTGQVHTIEGVQTAPMVHVDRVNYGELPISQGELPLLNGPVLAGEHGLLGVDGMSGRRLHMDFERDCVEISSARLARRYPGWGMVRGELRFGHLVILQGLVGRVRVNVLLDTGSDSSMANVALRDSLSGVRAREITPEARRAFTAGRPIVLDRAVGIPNLKLGDIEIRNVAAYVGDFHIFNLWGLQDEPTLLIGMDVLSSARAMSIDYQRATVHIRLRSMVGTRMF